MNHADNGKQAAALAALRYLEDGMVIGVGTGSTVNHFIDALAPWRDRLKGAVSSSESSTTRLRSIGIEVIDLNRTGDLELYVDGADETDRHRRLIKGGGGALTREKIVAAASRRFVCIVDESKVVDVLGRFPLPVEVIPMARSYVSRQMVKLGGQPLWRENVVTDNGNQIMWQLLQEDIVSRPNLVPKDGALAVSDLPGLGFELNHDAVKRAKDAYAKL